MISLIITRKFGWTFDLKEEKLKEVLRICNNNRKNIHYLNTKASMKLYEYTKKSSKDANILNYNLFYREFEYGKQRDGYWDGNHTAI